jgi:hypothetical protein
VYGYVDAVWWDLDVTFLLFLELGGLFPDGLHGHGEPACASGGGGFVVDHPGCVVSLVWLTVECLGNIHHASV